MAASALPETLKSITATKIQELTQQRDNFESVKAAIYSEAASANDRLSATQALLSGTSLLKRVRLSNDDSSDDEDYSSQGAVASKLRNNQFLLRQAQVDPSIQSSIVFDIRKSLERELELESVRHQHAKFFSELVTEWLSNPDQEAQKVEGTSFEEVGRKEMHEQRATWESLVFNKGQVGILKIEEYLKKLFTGTKPAQLAYENIVKQTKTFSSVLMERKDIFTADSLVNTMAGLLRSDLLSEEKNATLRTFSNNKEVLKEVSDVLNMRYASLSKWKWTTTKNGVSVEMRRQLNGKYRVFMDEDVLDALLLYDIGLKWSVHFKTTLTSFFHSFAWTRNDKTIPKKDRERREYFLENDKISGSTTVTSIRRGNYATDYFLTQLPVNEEIGKRSYDGDDDDEQPAAKGPLQLKHGLLHQLVAEALLARHLQPEAVHTVIRSDFKWFGPGLPHDTIYTVLKNFGVDDAWLDFFRRFLETPMSFVHDGPNATVQTRKRGIPISHTLGDAFGEVIMFVMDYAVNQATSSYLYRLHDDFWLWGSEETCLKAWQAMTKFANVMGLEFNEEKTGTVQMGPEQESDDFSSDGSDVNDSSYGPETTTLPSGDVRWGFLRLEAASGRFVVDQSQVDEHVKELKLQLSYCKSIFSYIQSYNAYVDRFFSNNFGKPSYGFGRDHVNMMIETFARIQKALFPNGSVTDQLAGFAKQRFGIEELPQGFWYFPVEQGGMELRNPLIPLLGMRESLRHTPQYMLKKTLNEDEAEYHRAKISFEVNGGTTGFGKYKADLVQRILDSGDTFLSKEEYLRYREGRSRYLGMLYNKFLAVPEEQEMESTPMLESLLKQGSPDLPLAKAGKPGLFSEFTDMQPYWKWIVALYGNEIVDRYGSVRMVDGEQVPLGVVSLMKKGRVRWRG